MKNLMILPFILFALEKPFPVKKSILENGLTVIVAEKRDLPIFLATVAVKTGSVYDPVGKEGTANLVGRLLDKGTKERNANEIAEVIEGLGGNLSISTGRWTTRVTLSILSKHRETGLEILSDILMNPLFKEDEIEREVGKVLSEINEKKSDPNSVLDDKFREALYGDHPLGKPVEGYRESLKKIKRGDIVEFYEKFYVPNNSILVIVSDINPDDVMEIVNRYFRKWKRKELEFPEIKPPKPIMGKRVIVVDMDVNQAFIALGNLGIERKNPDFNKLRVANYILGGGGFASRFFMKIRNEKGYAYSTYSYFSPGYKFPGYFIAETETKLESASPAINLMVKLIRDIREKGVKEKELDDARSFYEGSIPRQTETYSQIAGALLEEELYGLPLYHWLEDVEEIKSFKKEDIDEVAKKYFDPDNFVLVIVANKDSLKLDIEGVKGEEIIYEGIN
jgi:zinc protease